MTESEFTFTLNNGQLVVVTATVISRLKSYRQLRFFDPESGGVLIGEVRGRHLVITEISEPGPGDVRSRFIVNRKGSHHQQLVDLSFSNSKGTWRYLGEWHTHPEINPLPSKRDYCSWDTVSNETGPKVFIIVGREQFWVGLKQHSKVSEMKLVRSD